MDPPQADGPWTTGALLDWTARFLQQKGVEFPRLDAEVLLAYALGCKRIELYTRYDDEAAADARERFRDLVRRRVEGCPVAYLVGRKEFFGLELEANPAVLIPRPESEFVVMEALRLARALTSPRILDIGTGSGNLAVAITHQNPGAHLTAMRHGVAERIRFLEGDLFAPIPPGERFDLVVSNPPYIPQEDIPHLPVGVRDYEPHRALDGGAGGYVVLDRLLKEATPFLESGSYLILEIGSPQADAIRARLAGHPAYRLEETVQDHAGHPRVLRIRYQP